MPSAVRNGRVSGESIELAEPPVRQGWVLTSEKSLRSSSSFEHPAHDPTGVVLENDTRGPGIALDDRKRD